MNTIGASEPALADLPRERDARINVPARFPATIT
jgi:hypothetical protein